MSKRRKVLVKCDCGQVVAAGSVFCPNCKSKIDRKNARVIKAEDIKYKKEMRGKGKK
jgi:hypothetical protein